MPGVGDPLPGVFGVGSEFVGPIVWFPVASLSGAYPPLAYLAALDDMLLYIQFFDQGRVPM